MREGGREGGGGGKKVRASSAMPPQKQRRNTWREGGRERASEGGLTCETSSMTSVLTLSPRRLLFLRQKAISL